MKVCEIPDCGNKVNSLGLCKRHYDLRRNNGSPLIAKKFCGSLEERFWHQVKKSDDCWLWVGAMMRNGYGQIKGENRKTIGAHRVSYLIAYGAIPKGMNVLHKCDTPQCVNPSHLFLGTHRDNTHDALNKGRLIRNTNGTFKETTNALGR